MKWFSHLFFSAMLLSAILKAEVIDIESEMLSSFVQETRQIKIPGYPYAFNPSITPWKKGYLLCFRAGKGSCGEVDPWGQLIMRDPKCTSSDTIGLVKLNQEFELEGEVHLLELPQFHEKMKVQDPRFVQMKERTFLAYSDNVPSPIGMDGSKRRMVVIELSEEGGSFYTKNPKLLVDFDGEDYSKREKNWVPFAYEESLLFSRYIAPHQVMIPLEEKEGCLQYSYYETNPSWDWGEIRGGTQALKISDEEYLSFFHSSTPLKSVQSKKKRMLHYFMGAYTFSSKPPFKINRISPSPIVGEKFYNGPAYRTWKPLRVVFPGGMVIGEKAIWVVYGRQDHEVWICKLNREELLASLVEVN